MHWLGWVLSLPVALAVPEVAVNWMSAGLGAIKVQVGGRDDLLGKCLKSGLAMEYKYQIRLCRRRAAWFDACAQRFREKRVLSFDPISGVYTLEADRFDDAEPPQTLRFDSLEDARSALGRVEGLTLAQLSGGEGGFAGSPRAYVRVRVQSDCRGDYNRTLARISSFVTLGLVRISGFDTGWTAFRLDAGGAE